MLKLFDCVAPWMLYFARFMKILIVKFSFIQLNIHYFIRQEMKLYQTKICNSTYGDEAAKYYFDNRKNKEIQTAKITKQEAVF